MDTSLAVVLEKLVEQDLQVVPVCDEHGRIKGLVSTDDLLRGLDLALAKANGDGTDD